MNAPVKKSRHLARLNEAAEKIVSLPADQVRVAFVRLYSDHLKIHVAWRASFALNVLLLTVGVFYLI
jgi:hypothetical protein